MSLFLAHAVIQQCTWTRDDFHGLSAGGGLKKLKIDLSPALPSISDANFELVQRIGRADRENIERKEQNNKVCFLKIGGWDTTIRGPPTNF